MSFSVNQRVMEYGIRRSLGALSREIVALIFKRGAAQTLVGIALGAIFGYLLIAALSKGMDEIRSDLLTYLVPTTFLTTVAALALWLPSIRLTRLNLSDTLREGDKGSNVNCQVRPWPPWIRPLLKGARLLLTDRLLLLLHKLRDAHLEPPAASKP